MLRCVLLLVLAASQAFGSNALILRNSNLRPQPSTTRKPIRLLPSGSRVEVVTDTAQNGYVKVKTSEGETGWVWRVNLSYKAAESASTKAHLQRVGPDEIYPNPEFTPGATDSRVTQDNIKATICVSGWTSKVRPPVSVTNRIKADVMPKYHSTLDAAYYELDHLISLELGGCPDCEENLWPQPYGDAKHPIKRTQPRPKDGSILPGARQKDEVETYLKKQVCDGKITLQQAQRQIATDWYEAYKEKHQQQ